MPRHRSWSVRLFAASLVLVVLEPVGTAFATGGGLIPRCPAGVSAAERHDCIISSWSDPAKYGSPIQASLRAPLSRKWINASPSTGGAHWIYTGTVLIHTRLKICPQPTPLGAIPCQLEGTNAGLLWYQAGAKLAPPGPSGFAGSSVICNTKGTSCVYKFEVFPKVLWGHLQMIWTIAVTQLTKNPSNDLGNAGAEFPVSINVAKVKA